METLRKLERRCLRACFKLYHSEVTDYTYYINNTTLYNSADIPRLDNFTIKISRDYFSKLSLIGNKIINSPTIVGPFPEDYKDSGYIPSQIFIYIDHHGLVQNENNIPILYHWRRNNAEKRISFQPHDYAQRSSKFSCSTSIASRDLHDFDRLNMKKYWWLSNESAHIQDLKIRGNEIIKKRSEHQPSASQNENYDDSSVSQQPPNSNWVLYKLVYTYFYLRLKHSSSYPFKGFLKCIPIFSLPFLYPYIHCVHLAFK